MNGARGSRIPEKIFYIESTGFSDTLNQGGGGGKRKTGVIHDFKVYSLFNWKKQKGFVPYGNEEGCSGIDVRVKRWMRHQEFMKPTGHPVGNVEETAGYSYLKFRGEVSVAERHVGIISISLTLDSPTGKQQKVLHTD